MATDRVPPSAYDEDARTLLYDRTWENPHGNGGFRMTVCDANRGVIRSFGKGTMDGARAIVAHFNEALGLLGGDTKFTGLVDLRQLSGSPLRAQFVLGKWLVTHKALFERVGIYGGKPLEARMARAIIRMARMKQHVLVTPHEADALDFLGW